MIYKVSFIITLLTVLIESYAYRDQDESKYYGPSKFIHKNKQFHLYLRQPFLKTKDHHYHHHHFHDDEIGEHKYYVENYNHDRPKPPKYKKKKPSTQQGVNYHYYNPHSAYKFHEEFYGHQQSPYSTRQNDVNYQVYHNIHERPGHHGHRSGHHNHRNRYKRHHNLNKSNYYDKYGTPPYYQHNTLDSSPVYFYYC